MNRWIVLVVDILLLSIDLSHSKCSVKDSKGEPIVLNVLPPGVRYFPSMDLLQCINPNSCHKWKISDCTEVECKNSRSCKGAQLINNQHVLCSLDESCEEAKFVTAHKVTCGAGRVMSKRNFCENAVIESDQLVTCKGPGGCQSEHTNQIIVRVGAHGHVYCGNLNNRDVTCQNMVIEILHGDRACYDDNGDLPRRCAVVCANDWDCDKSSIQFRVVPS